MFLYFRTTAAQRKFVYVVLAQPSDGVLSHMQYPNGKNAPVGEG